MSKQQAVAFAQLVSSVGEDVKLHNKVLLALAVIANNLKWTAAAEVFGLLTGQDTCPRSARRYFEEVADVCQKIPQKGLRFVQREKLFPGATAIVDGTVVPCRAHRSEIALQKKCGASWVECKPPPSIVGTWEEDNWFEDEVKKCVEDRDPKYRLVRVDRTYSGKHQDRCWKFDVFVTMGGVPFHFRGPVPGAVHDKKLYEYATLFEHGEDEEVLADLGYVGARHCIVPFKGEVGEEQHHYNNHHAVVRSRIERFFAYLNVFKVFRGTDMEEENISRCMTIAIAIMFCLLAKSPQYEVEAPAQLAHQKACHCNSTLKHVAQFDPDKIREAYCAALKDVPCEPKKSRKRSRRKESWLEESYHDWKAGVDPSAVVL